MVSGNQIAKHWIAVILVSVCVSAVMSYVVIQMGSQSVANSAGMLSHSVLSANLPPNTLDCEQLIYSPVQNKCVSKEVFEREMARLFSALGVDASISQTNSAQ